MKSYSYVFSIVMLSTALVGCAGNQTRIGEGVGIGGLLGAAAGGIIGHQSGDGVQGALIGGAVGAGTGALVGAQIEKPDSVGQVQPTTTNSMTVQEIINLTKQGMSSDDIISKIRLASPKYTLTADDLSYLSNNGVSQRVIDVMQTYK